MTFASRAVTGVRSSHGKIGSRHWDSRRIPEATEGDGHPAPGLVFYFNALISATRVLMSSAVSFSLKLGIFGVDVLFPFSMALVNSPSDFPATVFKAGIFMFALPSALAP